MLNITHHHVETAAAACHWPPAATEAARIMAGAVTASVDVNLSTKRPSVFLEKLPRPPGGGRGTCHSLERQGREFSSVLRLMVPGASQGPRRLMGGQTAPVPSRL